VRRYAARCASGPEVNTLFVSEDPESVRMLYPDSVGLTFMRYARVWVFWRSRS